METEGDDWMRQSWRREERRSRENNDGGRCYLIGLDKVSVTDSVEVVEQRRSTDMADRLSEVTQTGGGVTHTHTHTC